MKITIKFTALPGENSAYIAGKRDSYWLELYKNGDLCAWIKEQTGIIQNTCSNVAALINAWTTIQMTKRNGSINLYMNGILKNSQTVNQPLSTSTSPFTIGSSNPVNGFYTSFSGEVSMIDVFDTAQTPSESSLLGDFNTDGKVDIFDYNLLVSDFGKTGPSGFSPADPNPDGKVDIFDYNILVTNFGKTL